MKVLIACEYSGTVRDAFLRAGHDAMSCDLLPTESPGPHYQGDVFDILGDGWDLMIAHPPCTYLCNSGVRWLHTEEGRWDKMQAAACFFRLLLDAAIERIAIENPIMHKYGKGIIGRGQDQCVQPHWFGDPAFKATCWWLKNLKPLKKTNPLEVPTDPEERKRWSQIHYASPGPNRSKERSKFFPGMAEACLQWAE